ncbi:snoRNA-binding rRNA-processing protein utp10 [Coniothyrium glycines]
MATALQRQLATIAAASTHQLDLRAQKAAHGKSLLFDARVAASQSLESVYRLCLEGFGELCALDPRFVPFGQSLFSEQSQAEDRAHMTRDENRRLDAVLDAFITLVGPRLLLRPAEKALEWLVRRFSVHEHNTECLVFAYLPWHNTPQFRALLSILPAVPPAALRFLYPYIQSPTSPPRRTIVYTAINTPAFFNAYQSHVAAVVSSAHQAPHMLSFWASIMLEAIPAILATSTSGRRDLQDHKTEELLLHVLPVLNTCMQARHGAATVITCYSIVMMLVNQANVGDKILDGLMDAVVLAQDEQSVDTCLACLAIMAAQRTNARFSDKLCKRILRIPQLPERLHAVSKQCQVQRLVLGCALGAVNIDTSQTTGGKNRLLDLLQLGVLTPPHLRIVLAALLQLLQGSVLDSEEHGFALGLVTRLTESQQILRILQEEAKAKGYDLEKAGLALEQSLDAAAVAVSEDEEMVEVIEKDSVTTGDEIPQLPSISATSFLRPDSAQVFAEISTAFAQAVSSRRMHNFLAVDALYQKEPLQRTLYFSFLARAWSTAQSVPVRLAAIRAATSTAKQVESAFSLQNLVPYLIVALADTSPLVRRSAATLVSMLSTKSVQNHKTAKWASSDLYGSMTKNVVHLKEDEFSTLLSSILVPILEEAVMDAQFVISALRDSLEGSQTSKHHQKYSIKAQTRTSILSFLASHVSLTPVLKVQLRLLPLFSFSGKVSDGVRNNTILPLARRWCSLATAEAEQFSTQEHIRIKDADRGHLDILLPREAKSVQLLQDIVSGSLSKERLLLAGTAFDRIASLWPALKSEYRLSIAQCLLPLALGDSQERFNILCKERALETLRTVKLDSTILLSFMDSIPSALQMPEGPPTKKRRRTSRSELARVELSSQDDLQRLLRHLTLVLELIESSEPGQHPVLFKSLFNIFGELQPLKQQSGSELVYLQSMILGSLSPIVNHLKTQTNTSEYQNAVRADLLIDCIRHSTSPQVQNSALLLIANLASWVPDLVLHNLMPIFTFIGSTLLRQQDDYSAQVVDKTISRVVPQLAASLRSKHKNFLNGVSDLLLSFTAAFEHIPLHRRLKLFSELARTLGPEDSLSAIIALLADRHHNNKTHLKFSTELLAVFDPVHTLDAIKGYLDLIVDALAPKPRISDTLFGLNEKQPAQAESTVKNLLSCLADLTTDDRLRGHVVRAFKNQGDSPRSRDLFASIVETTIQISRKVSSSPKLYELCSRVLAKSLDLLPTSDLIKSAELLLTNSDHAVQAAAVKAVELRAGGVIQNDAKSVTALLSFLPSVEHLLQVSQETDAKLICISCADRIIERFGRKNLSAVISMAQTISGPQSLSSGDDRIRILSLLCITSIVDILEDEAIFLLPTVVPTAFGYLSQAIENGNTGLHNAVFTLLSNIVERLGYVFSREYLETALRSSHRSATGNMNDTCDDSRRAFYQSVSDHLVASHVFEAIKETWAHAIAQGFEASSEHLELLRLTIDSQSKAKTIKASSALFDLLLQAFCLRSEVASQSAAEFDDEEIAQLESTLVEAIIAVVLKINDATFRPFFAQLVERQASYASIPQRAITFYTFLGAFFDKFKSIVTNYSSYIIEHTVKMLDHLSKDDSESEVRKAVLNALQKSFLHDQDGFWQAPSHYGAIMPPLLALLSLPSASISTPANNINNIIPTVTELAAASASSIENHREMNAILLRYMRSDSAHTRLATVLCEQSLTRRLGEEWLGLLPEMLPFISELREDDDEMVERETQRWITGVEEVLGESLEGMLQ